MNVSVGTGTPTAITINDNTVNSVYIQCRTAVNLELRREAGDSEYFTIKSGTVFNLQTRLVEEEPFYLQSASGSVTAEILLVQE